MKRIAALCFFFCLMLRMSAAETMAILEFDDLSSPVQANSQERVRKMLTAMFEKEFSIVDAQVCNRIFGLESQKRVGTITSRQAAMLGKVLQADLLVTGNYTISDNGSLIIKAAFIKTHLQESSQTISKLSSCLQAAFPLKSETEAKRFLLISSHPSGCHIELNKKMAGKTPLLLQEIQDGSELSLNKDGYQTEYLPINFYQTPYSILSLCWLEMNLKPEVKPALGSILVTSQPSSALVYLGQQLKGVTPILIPELEPGFYQLKVYKSGFKPQIQRVIIEPGKQGRAYLILERGFPPLPKPRASFELMSIQTNHLIDGGEVDIGLKYPEILIFRTGTPIKNMEFRVCGLGFGLKRGLTENLSLDLYYSGYEMRKWEKGEGGGASFILGWPIRFPFAHSWWYLGAGYYRDKGENKPRYFAGLECQLTQDLRLLMEYDRFDGSGLGIKFPLSRQIKLIAGVGKDKEEWRFDLGAFYEGKE